MKTNESRTRGRLHRHRRPARLVALALGVVAFGLARPPAVAGQDAGSDYRSVTVAVGKAALVSNGTTLRRVSVADADVAEAVVVSPTEVMIHGKQTGTTTLVLWDQVGARRLHEVEVTVDAEALERHFLALFPDERIDVTASGDTYILSGTLKEASVARRALEIAAATGATVIDNLQVPAPDQILLQVRFAEVNRTAIKEYGINILRFDPLNPRGDDEGALSTGQHTPPAGNFANDPVGPEQTFSDVVNLYLFHEGESVGAFIRALSAKGMFRSLAEPNLLAMDGQEASFLAGGEFPYPVPQATAGGTNITILFKEFGVRLNFTPHITNAGNIRLTVAPEVSSLDFANGLQLSGFQIPTLLSRRASTEVELRDGQTFAIGGLLDNSITENVDKFPILGDIPILGRLFSSKGIRENRTELLVLVTPRIVQPSEAPPPVPTGEPETWDWDDALKEPIAPAPVGPTGDE
ncbi:MAG: type II and III secretion system protein family protein [Gemmatimonadetes bacterium]|nr:type II and III secretion system protein family protein [Gemmatimonadota bacterium]